MNKFFRGWKDSLLLKSFALMTKSDQKKVGVVIFFQIWIGLLDLAGIATFGYVSSLVFGRLQSTPIGSQPQWIYSLLHISNLSFQNQILIMLLLAVILLIGRTILSIFVTRRVIFFFSYRGALISSVLISKILSQSILKLQTKTTQETLFAVTRGVELIVLHVLANTVILASDFSLLIIVSIGLFIIDPVTALSIFVIFGFSGYFLYVQLHLRAGKLGMHNSDLYIQSSEKILEVFSNFRETVVANRQSFYIRTISKLRFSLSRTASELTFMPYISKYVFETAVILGALVLGVTQFLLVGTSQAIESIAIFLIAGSRIAPAALRVQQGMLSIRGGLGQATPTLALIDELKDSLPRAGSVSTLDTIHEGFDGTLQLSNLSFTYPRSSSPTISNVTLTFPKGTFTAVVGPSGAGKTTLVDLMLGILPADKGLSTVSGLPPLEGVTKWPGAIAYVPQEVILSSGTIRENISLGYPIEAATDEAVLAALKIADLDEFVLGLSKTLDTKIGEIGFRFSGGQRQRIGIARAMFTKPRILVLDEATSSLDAGTEENVTSAISKLHGSLTLIVVAHRLSTIRSADNIVYLSKGEILATGTFEEVRKAVPDFDYQASIMGL